MLVVPSHKQIILNLGNPERVASIIPTTKPFVFKGSTLYAVPHKLEESKVLRNLGFDVPSPIKHYYDWPRARTDLVPFEAQRETCDFITMHRRGYILNDMGTGKTLSYLWAWDFLRREGAAQKLLVAAPLSTLQRVWGDEIFKNFPHLSYTILHGSASKRRKLLAHDFDIYVINHDGVDIILEELSKRPDITHILIDECATYRNHGTDLWRAMNAACNLQTPRAVHGMTGTPIPNEPTDAWAQCRLITPSSVPRYKNQFRDMVMRQGHNQWTWIARPDALETVYRVMQPAVRFSRDQCVDLPPVSYVTREVALTKEQEHAYKDMASRLAAEIGTGQVLAVNEGVKVSKLLQIACGAVYGADREVFTLPVGPRLREVEGIIEEAATKVLLFVPLTGALDLLAEHLRKRWSVEVVDGRTPKGKRDHIFSAFQEHAHPHIIVANPETMAHGLTLTKASTSIWYCPTTSHEIFDQANHRIIRPGQKHNQLIVMLEGTRAERRIYERLRNKQSIQGILLDLFKEGL